MQYAACKVQSAQSVIAKVDCLEVRESGCIEALNFFEFVVR
jgi:hypothetical protein